MTSDTRTAQVVLAEQVQLVARMGALTGEYHRLLQKVAAAGFARQMAEDGPEEGRGAALAEAEQIETAAKRTAETCERQIEALEQRLSALGRELSALK